MWVFVLLLTCHWATGCVGVCVVNLSLGHRVCGCLCCCLPVNGPPGVWVFVLLLPCQWATGCVGVCVVAYLSMGHRVCGFLCC